MFILGMHRSGTSAVTQLIASMGAYVGTPAEMLPASPDNPEGFFERQDVLGANRALLQSQHCNWYQVEGFDPARPAPPPVARHIAAIIGHLSAHAPFAVKDPRFCLTLPYWRFSGPVVLVLRHPAAIAHSLFLRNAMPVQQGLALWERYMTHALAHLEGRAVIRCQYEDFLADPHAANARLHGALTAHFPTLALPGALPFKPGLAKANPSGIALSGSQLELYERLTLSLSP